MILTLTPNPTIDGVYYLPSMKPDTVHRARKEATTPSGKGVDASNILRLLDEPTVALGFNAREMGKVLAGDLDELDVAHDFVAAEGEMRTVPVLVDESTGAEYTITAPSLMARPEHFAELLRRVQYHAAGAWVMIAAGSLPAGVPKSGYLALMKTAKEAGLITLLDTSGGGATAWDGTGGGGGDARGEGGFGSDADRSAAGERRGGEHVIDARLMAEIAQCYGLSALDYDAPIAAGYISQNHALALSMLRIWVNSA